MRNLDTVIQDLVIANRILAREEVVDAYGHISVRHPENPKHFFLARSVAPELVEAGDIVLVRSDPRDVPRIVELSRASYRKMVQNLWWATGYNVVAIPAAAGVLAPWGVLLSPAIGAMLMSISTLVVAINAQLLRRAKL